jgi:hypothetical protein
MQPPLPSGSATYDVAVVGGGPAGIAAALAAARRGARTVLIERSDILGGNATNAFVHTICGLYVAAGESPPQHAHPGFPRHFAEGLRRAGGAGEPERAGRVFVLPTYPPAFATYAAELCRDAAELTVWTNTDLVAADLSAAPLLTVRAGAARRDVCARIVVDTSGDATAAALANIATEQAEPAALQNPSYIVRVRGVDAAETRGFGRLRVAHSIAGATRDGDLPAGCEAVLLRPGKEDGEAYLTLNVAKPVGAPYAPLVPSQLAALTERARADAESLIRFLRANRAGFRDCAVAEWPRRLGVRETRRVRGQVEVTAQDILAAPRRDDEVAVSTWPIELWNDHRRAHFAYPTGAASVPLGALISRDCARLGMAGRCLSATHEALGALRVIATAMATGEAIGIAAALAADRGSDLNDIAPATVRGIIAA